MNCRPKPKGMKEPMMKRETKDAKKGFAMDKKTEKAVAKKDNAKKKPHSVLEKAKQNGKK